MKKIGLIGEDPNDTNAIKNLLERKYPKNIKFQQLLKNIRGHQLDNARVSKSLEIEYKEYKPNFVIFIRDADCISTEQAKIQKVHDWFSKLNISVNNTGILLMNVFELEALILADIATFNKLYRTTIKYSGNVMFQMDPKKFLKEKTYKNHKKYSESDCPNIFKQLDFDIVLNNCTYFKAFYEIFMEKVKEK